MANFPTIASGVTWWLNFQLIQVVPPGGQMVVKMEWALNVWNFDLFSMCMLIKCKNIVSRNIAHQICEKYTFLEKKYPKKSEKVDLVDLSPDLDFIMMRKYTVETSLHTSIPPVQVNHNQYHCLHHQAEAYSEYKCSRPRTLPQCVWRKLAASLSPPRRQQLEFLLHLQKNVCN